MKNQQLKSRILAFNRWMEVKKEEADDLEILLEELSRLPPGQLSHIMTDKVTEILARYQISAQ